MTTLHARFAQSVFPRRRGDARRGWAWACGAPQPGCSERAEPSLGRGGIEPSLGRIGKTMGAHGRRVDAISCLSCCAGVEKSKEKPSKPPLRRRNGFSSSRRNMAVGAGGGVLILWRFGIATFSCILAPMIAPRAPSPNAAAAPSRASAPSAGSLRPGLAAPSLSFFRPMDMALKLCRVAREAGRLAPQATSAA